MIQQIQEKIDVMASFVRGGIRPRAFIWNRRRFDLKSISLTYRGRDGRDTILFFNVSDREDNCFKLSFRPSTMEWTLLELYTPF